MLLVNIQLSCIFNITREVLVCCFNSIHSIFGNFVEIYLNKYGNGKFIIFIRQRGITMKKMTCFCIALLISGSVFAQTAIDQAGRGQAAIPI